MRGGKGTAEIYDAGENAGKLRQHRGVEFHGPVPHGAHRIGVSSDIQRRKPERFLLRDREKRVDQILAEFGPAQTVDRRADTPGLQQNMLIVWVSMLLIRLWGTLNLMIR